MYVENQVLENLATMCGKHYVYVSLFGTKVAVGHIQPKEFENKVENLVGSVTQPTFALPNTLRDNESYKFFERLESSSTRRRLIRRGGKVSQN